MVTLRVRGFADRRRALVVLGARSGTSALSGTLTLLGCTAPKHLMAANFANPKGYFEPQDITSIHDEMLATVGSSWSDWREFPSDWFASEAATSYRGRLISAFDENFADSFLIVLKDPRICRILPLWHQIFEECGVEPSFCFVYRNPLQVAQSLAVRDGSSVEQGLLYYIRNHLDAERNTRSRQRAFVSFDQLLADWRNAVASLEKQLHIDFPRKGAASDQVDSFLEIDLKHQNSERPKYEEPWLKPALEIYRNLEHLSSEEPSMMHLEALDRLKFDFDAWCSAN